MLNGIVPDRYITVFISKARFGVLYCRNKKYTWWIIKVPPGTEIKLDLQFIRIKTAFNTDWYADYKVKMVVIDKKGISVHLGEKVDFFAKGGGGKRWFQSNYVNSERKKRTDYPPKVNGKWAKKPKL